MSTIQLESSDLAELFGSPTELDRQTLVERVRALDRPLYKHAGLVAATVQRIADRLALDVRAQTGLADAAWLHDIGKLTIALAIRQKPGVLDAAEWAEMREHPVRGANFLTAIGAVRDAEQLVRHHHERFDGGGYPAGISGDAIPLGSRIICVADAYDAMTTERPYRRAMPVDSALHELRRCSGTQFDPGIVQALIAIQATAKKGPAS